MLVLGLMSGTSMDGIDAVLAEFEDGRFKGLRASHHLAYADSLRARLLQLARSDAALSLRELARLDAAVADRFADAALELLAAAGVDPRAVSAIGSHGQTVFHDTAATPWATQQLGDPNRIAARRWFRRSIMQCSPAPARRAARSISAASPTSQPCPAPMRHRCAASIPAPAMV
jgi:anhydro-N-acetylmuramic acid kinase